MRRALRNATSTMSALSNPSSEISSVGHAIIFLQFPRESIVSVANASPLPRNSSHRIDQQWGFGSRRRPSKTSESRGKVYPERAANSRVTKREELM